jgi:hypothetical protein
MTVAIRAWRGVIPIEVGAVIAIACISMPVPRALPLFIVASLSRWLRGKTWGEVARGDWARAGIAAIAGAAALAIALVAATPLVEAMVGRGVEWSQFPIVRGSASQLAGIVVVVAASACAAELALRGWIVERGLELGARPMLAVACGAFAEAALVDGGTWARAGAAVFGAALGWLYIAAERDVVVSCAARLAFTVGAVVLEGLRVIG